MTLFDRASRLALLPGLLTERILVLDGAMGTMLQAHKFTEADFRGERFRDHPRDLRGNSDLLCLTQPAAVAAIHAEFLHNEVPGITIPDGAREAMRAAGARGSEVGLEMADDLLTAMEGEVAGTYIMPSFGRYEQSAELVRRVRARHPMAVVA